MLSSSCSFVDFNPCFYHFFNYLTFVLDVVLHSFLKIFLIDGVSDFAYSENFKNPTLSEHMMSSSGDSTLFSCEVVGSSSSEENALSSTCENDIMSSDVRKARLILVRWRI